MNLHGMLGQKEHVGDIAIPIPLLDVAQNVKLNHSGCFSHEPSPFHATDEWLQQKMGEPIGPRLPYGLPITTFAGFTSRSALRLRWKRGLRITFGTWRNCWLHTLGYNGRARCP